MDFQKLHEALQEADPKPKRGYTPTVLCFKSSARSVSRNANISANGCSKGLRNIQITASAHAAKRFPDAETEGLAVVCPPRTFVRVKSPPGQHFRAREPPQDHHRQRGHWQHHENGLRPLLIAVCHRNARHYN